MMKPRIVSHSHTMIQGRSKRRPYAGVVVRGASSPPLQAKAAISRPTTAAGATIFTIR